MLVKILRRVEGNVVNFEGGHAIHIGGSSSLRHDLDTSKKKNVMNALMKRSAKTASMLVKIEVVVPH